jgi:hypothetical protein
MPEDKDKFMKKITFKIIALAAILSAGSAQAFDLNGLSAADIRASQSGFRAPAPQLKAEDDMIGVDLNVRIPFATLKKAAGLVAEKEPRLSILDKNAPIAFKSGEFMRITNLRFNQGGIIVDPTLTLKPYLAATDKLAIRIQKIKLHAVMEPSVKAAPPQISEEQIMEQVMDVLIKGVYTAVDDFLKKKQLPMKAQDVVNMRYDKASWTLFAEISSKGIHQLIHTDLMGELHLTGFSFNDKGLVLTIQTAE